ncbi:MAG TPA: SDR family NAD(P)-dependent oxidoreductase [Roseiflexaceae bacterium]|nr:SDR family NAD(P)-dependent oxidoreductase [Roseiflexaceae bacterium]
MDLRDKVVVITGASSGFGELIARRCAAAGARVVLAARSAGPLERLAESFGAERALAVPTDVADQAAVTRLAEATLDRFGRADVLVNNAGFGVLDRIEEADVADLQRMLDVNVVGAVRCTQAFLPHMRAHRRGQIVMMASIAGVISTMNLGFYSATKHALVSLARTLMLELAGTGVRCALICPGIAATGFQQHSGFGKYARIARWADTTPEHVADATVRAIVRRTHGEVYVPWYGRLLAVAAFPLPGATRLVMRLVR